MRAFDFLISFLMDMYRRYKREFFLDSCLRKVLELLFQVEDSAAPKIMHSPTGHRLVHGKKLSLDEMGFITIIDGKITEGWISADTMRLMQQIGALPPPPLSGNTTTTTT
jgi:hypothetical protein